VDFEEKSKGRGRPKKETSVEEPEENLGLKYTTVELPSNGKLGYPSDIQYRDILVRDEKELSMATERTFSKTLNNVLKSLLKDDSFYGDLTIYDRDFLLLWIWANNYSTIKTVEYKCPHCETKNTYHIDLTQVDIKDIDEDFKFPFPFTTSSGEKISLKLITTRDEEIARTFAAKDKNLDEAYIMLCQSVNFDTVIPLSEKMKRIENTFTGKDMAFVRGFHAHFKYGLNETVERNCSGCGEVNRFTIPFQADFFLPTLQSGFTGSV